MTCANNKVDVIIEQQRANPFIFRQLFDERLKQSDIQSNNGIETGLRALLSNAEERRNNGYNEFSVIMLGPSVEHQITKTDKNMINLISQVAQISHILLVDMQTSSNTHGILQEAFKSSLSDAKVKFFKWKDWEQNVGKEIDSSLLL